jgi:uncharacterized circularly permuted ATP-grasp superfamily protein
VSGPLASVVRHPEGGGYSAGDGAWDEAFTADGRVRPLYEDLLHDLAGVDLGRLCGAVSASMRSERVTFGDDVFPLDPVPRLIQADEWYRVARGIEQRGRALAAFVADVYGEREIVGAGLVPERAIELACGFEPWMMGVPVSTAGFVAGLDLVRCEDGELRVLEDNTRTPSGISYAVAARAALDAHPPASPPPGRLDPVDAFGLLHAALFAAAPEGARSPRLALLSDGPHNSAWYEHREIARRLGIPLLRPRDLVVRHSELWGWIDGRSRRVDVVLRRTNEDRLRDDAGGPTWLADLLLEPVRRGALTVVNPLGVGVADDKVVHAYVEAMVRFYVDEQPLLQSVPTLDLGDQAVRESALQRLGELVIKPRGGTGGAGIVVGRHASAEDRSQAATRVAERPDAWAAQETVTFSTHPTACSGALEPRHVDLRPFVIGGDEAAAAAPGALTRVAFGAGALVVNSSQRGGVKDTWIVP